MNIQESLSQRIARLRREKGFSQKELASRAGLSPRMIAYYETDVSHPSIDKLEKIAIALDISLVTLVTPSFAPPLSDNGDFISNVNMKTLKQLKKILLLSPQDRSTIYKMVDSLLLKEKE